MFHVHHRRATGDSVASWTTRPFTERLSCLHWAAAVSDLVLVTVSNGASRYESFMRACPRSRKLNSFLLEADRKLISAITH